MKVFVVLILLIGVVTVAGCGEEMEIVESVMDRTVVTTTEPQPPVIRQPGPVPTSGDMVLIPAGAFQMGSNAPEAFIDEQPVRTVNVAAFSMDRYEVTNAQYKRFVDANPQWQKGQPSSEIP